MKIIVTFANYAAAAHVGGDVERESVIIDVQEEKIPKRLKDHLDENQSDRKWQTVSMSLLIDS